MHQLAGEKKQINHLRFYQLSLHQFIQQQQIPE
jgi:hypothetical protein